MSVTDSLRAAAARLLTVSLAAGGLGAGGLAGCWPGYVHVTMSAQPDTNSGRPLQVVVRAVDEQAYRSEPYTAVAAQVIQPDKSVLKVVTLDPMARRKRSPWVKQPDPKRGRLALYVLYSTPSGSWRMLLGTRPPWRLLVPLGRSGISVEEIKECRVFLGEDQP
jgi:hypothetical protein